MPTGMKKMPRIRGNKDPNPNWSLTGEIVQGQPVYYYDLPNYVVRDLIGPDGKEVWEYNEKTNRPIRKIRERVIDPDEPTIRKEFIIVDLGNGITQKNFYFRPDPEEVQRVEAQEALADPSALLERFQAMEAELTALRGEGEREIAEKPILLPEVELPEVEVVESRFDEPSQVEGLPSQGVVEGPTQWVPPPGYRSDVPPQLSGASLVSEEQEEGFVALDVAEAREALASDPITELVHEELEGAEELVDDFELE